MANLEQKNILFFDKSTIFSMDADFLIPRDGRHMVFHLQFLASFGSIQFDSKAAPNFDKVIMYSSLKHDFSLVKHFGRNKDDLHPYLIRQGGRSTDRLLASLLIYSYDTLYVLIRLILFRIVNCLIFKRTIVRILPVLKQE